MLAKSLHPTGWSAVRVLTVFGGCLLWVVTSNAVAQDVVAPRLMRQATTKLLYPDRTPKVVAGTNFYSDDSRLYHGQYVEYYPSGRVFCRGEYLEGRRHGVWEFLREDGAVAKAGEYDRDRPVGLWQIFRTDGKKLREESYKMGIPHGRWAYFAADGTTAAREIEFDEGRPVQ